MKHLFLAVIVLVLFANSCTKSSNNLQSSTNDSSSYTTYTHFKMKTWEQTVPCNEVWFTPTAETYGTSGDSVAYITFANFYSASTNFVILINFPGDSTHLSKILTGIKFPIADMYTGTDIYGDDVQNIRNKYGIRTGNMYYNYLGFSVPKTLGDSVNIMYSYAADTGTYYNVITKLNYKGRSTIKMGNADSVFATYLVSGNFRLLARDMHDTSFTEVITGDYTYGVYVVTR